MQHQITRIWYKIELYLQWPTNRKSHMVYRMAPFSLTLNDPHLVYKVTPFFDTEYLKQLQIWPWLLYKASRKLQPSFRMAPILITLSEL